MSLLTRQGRISVAPFASVPSLANLPPIQRAQASVSDLSSRGRVEDEVDLSEGCFLTKSLKYTHQLGHWINVDQNEDAEPVEVLIEEVLRVTPIRDFRLDYPCNLALFERFVHTALDLYAFIAITPSLSTLEDLIKMVQSDNDPRQLTIDQIGETYFRSLNFNSPCVTNPEYELVALHPEHFLPHGGMLTVYDPSSATYKHYVAATDRRLRETPDPSSPCLPPFHHVSDRFPINRPNVFLIAINAEIKFRRYFEMAQPTTPLPADVINLMRRTMDLVNLLYWEPVPKEGSPGETMMAERLGRRPKNPASSRRSIVRWFKSLDLEARMAYGRSLMCGHDLQYDPALFEDAIPLDDPHPYSEKTTVKEWRQGVPS